MKVSPSPKYTLFAAGLLLVGVAMQAALYKVPITNRSLHGKSLSGFISSIKIAEAVDIADLPLGSTEAQQEKVEEILCFNDYVYRKYAFRDGSEISLYIAYWRAGRQRFREMSRHTPDVCWPNCGWRLLKSDFAFLSGPMPVAQYRLYESHGVNNTVLFWEISDGQSVAYPTTSPILPYSLQLRDIIKMGMNQRGEQYFIRLSCNKALDNPSVQSAFPVFFKALAIIADAERGMAGAAPL